MVAFDKNMKEALRVKDGEVTKQKCENIEEPSLQDPDILEEIRLKIF